MAKELYLQKKLLCLIINNIIIQKSILSSPKSSTESQQNVMTKKGVKIQCTK